MYIVIELSLSTLSRRVHISQKTLDFLGNAFEVEEGNGAERDSYLKEHNVVTYFIKENVS